MNLHKLLTLLTAAHRIPTAARMISRTSSVLMLLAGVAVAAPDAGLVRELKPLSVRGVNYFPRETPWSGMWTKTPPEVFEKDMALAASLGCNTIRTFLQFSASLEQAGLLKPDGSLTPAYHEKIEQMLAAAWRHGIRVVVCFEFSSQWLAAPDAADRWQRALGNVVAKHRDDGRVLMWDFDPARRRGARSCRRCARVVPPRLPAQQPERIALRPRPRRWLVKARRARLARDFFPLGQTMKPSLVPPLRSSPIRGGILLLLLGLCHPGALSAQEELAPLERIGIRCGGQEAEFVLKDSGAPFFVKGFNYIRLRAAEGASAGDHSTFDADTRTTKACYDANRAEAMFSALSKGGYHERIVAAVKAVDPEMLVAEGVFVPRAVGMDVIQHAGVWPGKKGDERYPPTLTTLGKTKLDFLDVHFYRTSANEPVAESFRLNLGSTGFFTPEMAAARKAKPVIMGEFGAFDFVEKTFEEAVESMVQVRDLALKERMNGMLYWTYDCFEQPSLHHAAKDWTLFVRKMGNFEIPTGKQPTPREGKQP